MNGLLLFLGLLFLVLCIVGYLSLSADPAAVDEEEAKVVEDEVKSGVTFEERPLDAGVPDETR